MLKVSGQAAHFVLAVHLHLDGVVLARHFGGGAVELLHRFHDAAGQQVSEQQAERNRHQPEQRRCWSACWKAGGGRLQTSAECRFRPRGLRLMSSSGVCSSAYSTTPSLTRLGVARSGDIGHHGGGGARIQRGGDHAALRQEQELAAAGGSCQFAAPPRRPRDSRPPARPAVPGPAWNPRTPASRRSGTARPLPGRNRRTARESVARRPPPRSDSFRGRAECDCRPAKQSPCRCGWSPGRWRSQWKSSTTIRRRRPGWWRGRRC